MCQENGCLRVDDPTFSFIKTVIFPKTVSLEWLMRILPVRADWLTFTGCDGITYVIYHTAGDLYVLAPKGQQGIIQPGNAECVATRWLELLPQ